MRHHDKDKLVPSPITMERLICGGELNQSAHHRSLMMCRWRLVWVRLGLASNSRI